MHVSATKGQHRGQRAHHVRQARWCQEVPHHHQKHPARWNLSKVRRKGGNKEKNVKRKKEGMIHDVTGGDLLYLLGVSAAFQTSGLGLAADRDSVQVEQAFVSMRLMGHSLDEAVLYSHVMMVRGVTRNTLGIDGSPRHPRLIHYVRIIPERQVPTSRCNSTAWQEITLLPRTLVPTLALMNDSQITVVDQTVQESQR